MPTAEATKATPTIQTFQFCKERQIAAPIDIVFETVVQPVGPLADQKLKLEQWPGGRWFRDLGNNTGHLWGHVQVIKPPKLLEICGPMMMSYPVSGFLQYRLVEEAGGTLLKLTHQAVGLLNPEHMEGLQKGWTAMLEEVQAVAERRAGK
jgi:uncharacterized protein YndB with AHSA1/START domain